MKHFEETAKRATDTIFQERYGVFEQAYHDKLLRFLEETAFLAEKYEPFVPNMEYLLIDIGCSVLNTLIHLGVRSMIVLLEKKQDELIGDTAEARYDDFVTRYASGHFDDIFPEGSEARWLIENRLSLTLTALSELFARLERDREDIHSHLGIEIGAVRRISMSLGDTHGNGRSVYVLTCGGGEKLVYKPHSLHNDILMNRTYDWFCRQERLKTDMKHVAVIDRGDYGWQCFVEGRENPWEVS